MRARFEGKVAVVTGGAQGIGRAITEGLASEGGSVVIFDVDGDRGERTVTELGTVGLAQVGIRTGDVADRASVRAAIEYAVDRFGKLDIMVAHAGIADIEPFLAISDPSWRRMLDVNLSGAFYCIQEAARAMVGGGSIVVTASTNAFWVESNASHYNASKGGVVALVRSAALDLAQRGIRVNAVDPGLIRTRLTTYVTDDSKNAADYLQRIPLRRFGEPTDVAEAVLFLASEQAAWITGQEIIVDGGQTLGTPLPLPETALPGSARAEASA